MNNELIEAAKAVIARWDSTDWESAPTIHAMNRLRAALSAKAEPECAGVYDCQNKAQREWWDMREGKLTMTHCQHMEEIEAVKGFLPIKPFGSNPDYCKPAPAKLPEVEEWIYHNCRREKSDDYMEVIEVPTVDAYLQQLTAAHAAELAEKDAEIERLKGLLTIYFNAQQEKTK